MLRARTRWPALKRAATGTSRSTDLPWASIWGTVSAVTGGVAFGEPAAGLPLSDRNALARFEARGYGHVPVDGFALGEHLGHRLRRDRRGSFRRTRRGPAAFRSERAGPL